MTQYRFRQFQVMGWANRSKRVLLALGGVLLCSVTLNLQASEHVLQRTDSGPAEVILIPVLAASEEVDTLARIVNVSDQAVVFKTLFRDLDGQVAGSYNVYLARRASWTFALGLDGEQQPQLHLSDEMGSCLLDADGPVEGSVGLPANGGLAELIVLGRLDGAGNVPWHEAHRDPCAELAERWDDEGMWQDDPTAGLLPPASALVADVSAINVTEGARYDIPVAGLVGFSADVRHTQPGAVDPSLSMPQGTPILTRICGESECIEDAWDVPLEAVASLFMTEQLGAPYSALPELGGEAEFRVVYPFRHTFEDLLGEPIQESVAVDAFSPDGRPAGLEECETFVPTPVNPLCRGIRLEELPMIAFSLSYGWDRGGNDNAGLSSVLEVADGSVVYGREDTYTISTEGTMWLRFRDDPDLHQHPELVSNSGRIYRGAPAYGIALEKVINEVIDCDQGQCIRASYGLGKAMLPSRNME